MRAVVGVLYCSRSGYWGSSASALVYGASPSWLLIPTALALLGAWWPGLRCSGVGLILFGAHPALLITGGVAEQISRAARSCWGLPFGGANPDEGPGICPTVDVGPILVGLIFWALAPCGAFLLYRLTRVRARNPVSGPTAEA